MTPKAQAQRRHGGGLVQIRAAAWWRLDLKIRTRICLAGGEAGPAFCTGWGRGGFSMLTLQPPPILVTNIDGGLTMMVSTAQGPDTLVNQTDADPAFLELPERGQEGRTFERHSISG